MKKQVLAITIGLALMVPALMAQTGATIEQRKDNQQQRVGSGVQDGSLTAGEAAKIEKQEAGLNREQRAMRRQDSGKLTPADRQALNRQQSRLSREIYRDRHNAAAQAPANGPINDRKRMQQARIGQGIKSGSMTAGEAAKLERKEAGLNKEERGMRQENGGRLTAGDRKLVNKQQNQLSKKIYKDKHNGAGR